MSGVVTASLPLDPTPRRQDEARDLHAVMTYLSWALPPDGVANHSPGEGKRSKLAQIALRRSGYQAGWPDVAVHYRGSTIFIELKTAKGALSEVQRAMHRKLTYCGFPVLICRTPECVEESLRELGVPLRGSYRSGPPRRVYELTREPA